MLQNLDFWTAAVTFMLLVLAVLKVVKGSLKCIFVLECAAVVYKSSFI